VIYALAFFSMFFLDLCFGFYTKAVQLDKKFVASNWAVGISLANILAFASAVKDYKSIPFVLAGAWLGTYLSVLINLKRKRKHEQNTLLKT